MTSQLSASPAQVAPDARSVASQSTRGVQVVAAPLMTAWGMVQVGTGTAVDAPAATDFAYVPEPCRRREGALGLLRSVGCSGPKRGVLARTGPGEFRFEFFQGLPDGSVDPAVATCVNSMSAALAATAVRWEPSLLAGTTTTVLMDGLAYGMRVTGVQDGNAADTTVAEPSSSLSGRGAAVVSMPGEPMRLVVTLQVTVPFTAALQAAHVLTSGRTDGGQGYLVTAFPQPYLLVDTGADGFFDPVPSELEIQLEALRSSVARDLGLAFSPSLPKLGLLARTPCGPPLFRTRLAAGSGWHPGAPGSGLLAAAAAEHAHSRALAPQKRQRRGVAGSEPRIGSGSDPGSDFEHGLPLGFAFATPAGPRSVGIGTTPDGQAGLSIPVTVTVPADHRPGPNHQPDALPALLTVPGAI